jgi:hypothetical protein
MLSPWLLVESSASTLGRQLPAFAPLARKHGIRAVGADELSPGAVEVQHRPMVRNRDVAEQA